jgi:hypothetical protein
MKCGTLCAEPVRKQIMEEIHLGHSGTEQGILAGSLYPVSPPGVILWVSIVLATWMINQ